MAYSDGIMERIERMFDDLFAFVFPGVPEQKDASKDKSAAKSGDPPPGGEGIVVSGVELSPLVAEQLARLGLSLNAYTKWQLEAAQRACAFDCNLIDDPNGLDFEDQLELTDAEKNKNRDDGDTPDENDDDDLWQLKMLKQGHGKSTGDYGHRDRIRWQRVRQKQALAAAEENGEPLPQTHGV